MKKYKDADHTAAAYNEFGKLYHESRVTKGRFFNEFLEMPATLSLVPESLQTKIVLDAGCGTGIYARELAHRGAQVFGVDISSTMIDIARKETSSELNVNYDVGNLYEIKLEDSSVDLIICNYVLENIENLETVILEFHRVLRSGGECIYSVSHPIRALSKKEMINEKEVWQLENYFDKSVRVSDFGQGLKVNKYNRTVSDYINLCAETGFVINKILEPQPITTGKDRDAVAYDASMRLPQLLIVKMFK